jgi:glycosyltransferase involved in cell wall biosynthesis
MLVQRDSLPPGGAETQVVMLARALARRNLRVAIIAFGDPTQLPSQVEGVRIAPRPPYKLHRQLKDDVVEVIRMWRSLWQTPSRTIVYRGAGIELGLIACYAMLARRRLIFATAHLYDFDHGKLMKGRPSIVRHRNLLIYRLGLRLVDAIVVQTEEQVPLCEANFGRKPLLIKSLQPLAKAQDRVPEAFLWVGRLVSYKRPLDYIALARALPDSKFWMIGVPTPSNEEDRLLVETVMAESRQVPNLELLPPRPHGEIGALMAGAVAVVNTSDFEGMPNVLLEAWSRGVPALVLNHDPGGVVDGHRLGGNAHGSLERLVELARQHWLSREDRADVSERCRTYVQRHHAPEVIAQRWANVISKSSPAKVEASTIGRIPNA